MKFIWLIGVLLLGFSCQTAGKKQTKSVKSLEKSEQEAYDYRQALQFYEIGINHYHNKEMADALVNLQKAVTLDPGNFRYRHGLSLAYSTNGQVNEAIVEIKESLRINPLFTEGTNLLGTYYTETGEYDLATQCFKAVLQDKSYGQPQFAYFNLGKAKQLQGKTDEAIAAYSLAVQLDPDFYRGYIALGELYKLKNDYEKVLLYYQKAEPNYRTDTNVLYNIGHALFRLKRYERAKSYLAQVSILFPPPDIDTPTQQMLKVIDRLIREQQK